MSLVLRDLCVAYPRGADVVRGVSLSVPSGQVTCLLGPNGAGKSTLLKALVGLVPYRGAIQVDGVDLAHERPTERARRVAYVPQRSQLAAPLAVREVVQLGRFAHRGPLGGPGRGDRAAVEAALEQAGVQDLAARSYLELSGGEQQRVMLARALATGAGLIVLDEPTSAQDVRHVLELHTTLRMLAQQGRTVLVVLHDLAEALRHTDRAVLLYKGAIHAEGPVADVVHADAVRAVYGVELTMTPGPTFHLEPSP